MSAQDRLAAIIADRREPHVHRAISNFDTDQENQS